MVEEGGVRRPRCPVVAACMSGCGEAPDPPELVPLPASEVVGDFGCAGAELPAVTFRLNPSADPPTWIEFDDREVQLLWPRGYGYLADELIVVDPDGTKVLRDGQRVEGLGVCATPDDSVMYFHSAASAP